MAYCNSREEIRRLTGQNEVFRRAMNQAKVCPNCGEKASGRLLDEDLRRGLSWMEKR